MPTEPHPFDPGLSLVDSPTDPVPADSRQLFYALLNNVDPGQAITPAFGFVKQQLANIIQKQANNFYHYQPEQISLLQQRGPDIAISLDSSQRSIRERLLLQVAPVVLTEPCWLQGICQAATSETEIALQLMALYCKWTKPSLIGLYRGQLAACGIEISPVNSWAFAGQQAILPCLFQFAALQLALARFPRVLLPEILGFTLAHASAGNLLDNLFTNRQQADDFFTIRHKQLISQQTRIRQILVNYLNLFPGQAPACATANRDDLWQRIQSGFQLYRQQTENCLRQLAKPQDTSTQTALLQILQQKARAARGHHGQIQLDGRCLDEWFRQEPFDGKNFLTALKRSPYIHKDHPGQSPLLALFEFGGPMFGVLDTNEKQILKDWLTGQSETRISAGEIAKPVPASPVINANRRPLDDTKVNNRERYFYLVNADLYPQHKKTSAHSVQRLLYITQCLNRLPFARYQHCLFDDYIESLYRRETEAYQPLTGRPALSRSAYIWGIEQLAPMVLADGCWLQGISALTTTSQQTIVDLLWRIYADETGDGRLQQNHPHIYRRLLESLNIDLAPIHSREFCQHKGFIGSAFDLPVYLLSISHFPSTFLPEILGLNMAIELSGLGRVYMRLSDELNYWGIDSSIVDLHISIDNFASGHAALAKKAIQLYLDDIACRYGNHALQQHWRRIHNGYCSLQTALWRFKYALPFNYLLKKYFRKYTLRGYECGK